MQILHETEGQRFVASTEAGEGELAYLRRDTEPEVLDLVHTFVPPGARGQGVGEALVEHALAHAREQGYRVRPSCPFVRGWLAEHPEQQDLVVPLGDH